MRGLSSARTAFTAPGDLVDRMTEAYPGLANPYTLWVAAYDQVGA